MNIFRIGSRIISHTSPVAFAATGVALALSIPRVRKGLRTVAAVALAGVLGVADSLRNPSSAERSEMNIVTKPQETNGNRAFHPEGNLDEPPDEDEALPPAVLASNTPTPDDTKPVKRSSPRRVRKKELPT